MCNIDKIKALIKLKGLKIGAVCEQVGVGRTFLTDAKKGKCEISDERLERFAKVLGTSVDYLTDKTDDHERGEESSEETEYDELDLELFKRIEVLPDDMKGWLLDTLDRLEGKK